ncbi:MAG: endolytic transglycosylase MltG [Rhodocyclaceae bacterium]|nr:endolytic transglycosylase MltG [Rhodocyclaceae bacterium]
MARVFAAILFVLCVAAIAISAAGVRYFRTPLNLPTVPFDFTVEKGRSLKAVAQKLTDAGLLAEPYSLWLLGRLTDEASKIQAGRYRLVSAISPMELLQKMVDGDVLKVGVTFVEGVTFREMRAALEQNPDIRVTLKGLSANEILRKLAAPETHPEGLFFPDTYQFSPGTSDLDILRASYQAMRKKLNEAWQDRAQGLPYQSPYEALIMASIVEKETGRADERPQIAGVFVNRLRMPMRLQTDPTVIYGMGEKFDGNIRRRDLMTDTPYNTYTRDGLPPTPIAMPGLASIKAALNPAATDKLYFVATGNGDGSHVFSRTLDEHNRAVAKYQLGR